MLTMFVKVNKSATNVEKAQEAWGGDLPQWVADLANACDRSNQRAVGERLGRSSGYVSRILSAKYTGSYEEAEQLVRSKLNAERIVCPVWDSEIMLSACIRYRRYRGVPHNHMLRTYASACPRCPNNTDAPHADHEEIGR